MHCHWSIRTYTDALQSLPALEVVVDSVAAVAVDAAVAEALLRVTVIAGLASRKKSHIILRPYLTISSEHDKQAAHVRYRSASRGLRVH